MIVFAPHTVTPCEIAVCRSTINASDRWPVRLQTRVRWSALRLNRFITEDDTSPVHSKLPEVGKNPVDTAYDVGSVQLPYRSDRGAADTSIRPTCFSEAYYTAPIKVRQLLTAAGYVLEASYVSISSIKVIRFV
ncbi:hypothetical protein TNCV_779441 [Trichonephila clavipes]|nr:hypothetical protein TNCV_779441 [Trichonephila clavipes]